MLPIYCPLCCDQPFEDQQSLFFHLRGLRNNLFCSICSEKFPTLEALVTHLSRTCNGPTSPNAKRKVLNISKEPPLPDESASPNSSKGVETVGQITSSSSPPQSGEIASEFSDDVEILQVIPKELRNRLSKNVTLTVESNLIKKETNISTNQLPSKSGKIGTERKISVSAAVDKVLQKPGVELTLTVPQSKSSDKSSHKPRNNSDVGTDSSITQQKPGPLSSKSPEKRKSDTAFEESAKKRPNLSENQSHTTKYLGLKKVIVGHQSSLISTTTSSEVDSKSHGKSKRETTADKDGSSKETRGRGRPRKFPPTSSPSVEDLNSKQKLANRSRSKNRTSLGLASDKLNRTDSPEVNRKSVPVEQRNGDVTPNSLHANSRNVKTEEGSSGAAKNNLAPQSNSKASAPTTGIKTEEKATTGFKTEEKEEEKAEEEEEEEEEEYTCSACNVRFTSIYDHIKQYHNGEEVVVEVPPDEIKEDLKAYQEDPNIKVAIEPNTPDSTQVKKEEEVKKEKETKSDKNKAKTTPSPKPPVSKPERFKSPSTGSKPNNIKSHKSTLTQKIKEFGVGKWMHCPTNGKKGFFQYVRDHIKRKRLIAELLESKAVHQEARIAMKDLFENPKINVIEITNASNTPPITHKEVNFKKPMPMYIKEYKCSDEHDMLGGIASYVISGGGKRKCAPVPETSEIVAVMRVVLASDRVLTVENISFKDKPTNENMIPVLEDVTEPKIPLLQNAKILKWRCVKCLHVTWKFPLNNESHSCNSCPVCHKSFAAYGSLKSHSVVHKKDGSKFCEPCQDILDSRGLVCKNLKHPSNYTLCEVCKLNVVTEQKTEHRLQHQNNPYETLPCSVCKKVFGSVPERKLHETSACSRLVAKFNCSKCDQKFFSLTALNFHSNQHNNCKLKFPCRFCKKVFLVERELKTIKAGHKKPSSFLRRVWHERIHSRDRPFGCAACPKRFRSQPHQRSHFTSVHESPHLSRRSVAVHPCTQCDTRCASAELLKAHAVTHETAAQPSTSSQTAELPQ